MAVPLFSLHSIILILSYYGHNYRLLVSHPGEAIKSMWVGGYYYHLEYYYCTKAPNKTNNYSTKPYESITSQVFIVLVLFKQVWH